MVFIRAEKYLVLFILNENRDFFNLKNYSKEGHVRHGNTCQSKDLFQSSQTIRKIASKREKNAAILKKFKEFLKFLFAQNPEAIFIEKLFHKILRLLCA